MERAKRLVHAKDVYRKGYTGRGVRIAILDTGVYLHPEIKNNVIFFKDFINNKKESYDDNGHGTHVAGILSANGKEPNAISGMAPEAELLVFKVLDKDGNGSAKKVINALEWILKHHKIWNIKLLNFSMGFLPNTNPVMQNKLIEILETLWEQGVTIVTAAGNNGPQENSVTVPGISRKVITVGTSDEYSSIRNHYGGRGPTACCIVKPEILAPGTDILSLSNKAATYEKKSGTSMSVPIVCGALALLLEKNPWLKPVEIKLLLYDSVDRSTVENRNVWGILNVDNLIKML